MLRRRLHTPVALGGCVDPHRLQPIHRPVRSQMKDEFGVAKDIAIVAMDHKQGGGLDMGLEGTMQGSPTGALALSISRAISAI